jgi:hypothetical protein
MMFQRASCLLLQFFTTPLNSSRAKAILWRRWQVTLVLRRNCERLRRSAARITLTFNHWLCSLGMDHQARMVCYTACIVTRVTSHLSRPFRNPMDILNRGSTAIIKRFKSNTVVKCIDRPPGPIDIDHFSVEKQILDILGPNPRITE